MSLIASSAGCFSGPDFCLIFAPCGYDDPEILPTRKPPTVSMVLTPDNLINTSRGPIVDQKALTKALEERNIAGAGLDVLEKEPPDADDPILKLDNVIFAPHALCWTDQCFAGNGAADVRAVLDVQHGGEPRVVVNREVLETAAWRNRLLEFRKRFAA
jgi:hypothetical protein